VLVTSVGPLSQPSYAYLIDSLTISRITDRVMIMMMQRLSTREIEELRRRHLGRNYDVTPTPPNSGRSRISDEQLEAVRRELLELRCDANASELGAFPDIR
jgi:hypothetical protein